VIIDRETFTELTVHLQLASDAILKTARHLAALAEGETAPEERYAAALDRLMAMAMEMIAMESILSSLLEANRVERSAPAGDKKAEPPPSA
jgi:hypothetical protein